MTKFELDKLMEAMQNEYQRFHKIISRAKKTAEEKNKTLVILCGESHKGIREFSGKFIISKICLDLGINNQNFEQSPGTSIHDLSSAYPLSPHGAIVQYAYQSGAKIADIDMDESRIVDPYESIEDADRENPNIVNAALDISIKIFLARNNVMTESILSQGDTPSVAFIGYGHMHGMAAAISKLNNYFLLPLDITHEQNFAQLSEDLPDIPWLLTTIELPKYEKMAINFDEDETVTSENNYEHSYVTEYQPVDLKETEVTFNKILWKDADDYLSCYTEFLSFSGQQHLSTRKIFSKHDLQKHIWGTGQVIVPDPFSISFQLDDEPKDLEVTFDDVPIAKLKLR